MPLAEARVSNGWHCHRNETAFRKDECLKVFGDKNTKADGPIGCGETGNLGLCKFSGFNSVGIMAAQNAK